jgi:hypothetical protein
MLYHFEPWESFPEAGLEPPEDVGVDEDECEDPDDDDGDDFPVVDTRPVEEAGR